MHLVRLKHFHQQVWSIAFSCKTNHHCFNLTLVGVRIQKIFYLPTDKHSLRTSSRLATLKSKGYWLFSYHTTFAFQVIGLCLSQWIVLFFCLQPILGLIITIYMFGLHRYWITFYDSQWSSMFIHRNRKSHEQYYIHCTSSTESKRIDWDLLKTSDQINSLRELYVDDVS